MPFAEPTAQLPVEEQYHLYAGSVVPAPLHVASENSSNASPFSNSSDSSRRSSKGSGVIQQSPLAGGEDVVMDVLESIAGPSNPRVLGSPRFDYRREADRRRRELINKTLHEIRTVLPGGSSNLEKGASKAKILEKAAEYIAELKQSTNAKESEISDLEAEIEDMKRKLEAPK
ncbi:hypothetical protein HDU98_004245 [Podochytrium sp. JEL0797]|nr:hypothetical protein HDU98_004245 [Podochytrium sp. JEL0797]